MEESLGDLMNSVFDKKRIFDEIDDSDTINRIKSCLSVMSKNYLQGMKMVG